MRDACNDGKRDNQLEMYERMSCPIFVYEIKEGDERNEKIQPICAAKQKSDQKKEKIRAEAYIKNRESPIIPTKNRIYARPLGACPSGLGKRCKNGQKTGKGYYLILYGGKNVLETSRGREPCGIFQR